jgi:predicted DNA-binding protein with PD1-like motif
MISKSTKINRVIMIRINPNDDILLSLRQAVQDNAIKNAVILAGFGSVRSSHFHVVTSSELPPAEGYPKSDQPLDVIGIQGLVIDGRVHAHISFSDERNGFGGHLEEGCRALTFTVVAVGEVTDIDVAEWDSVNKIFGKE